MKMLAVEKRLVNREAKGLGNFERLRPWLHRHLTQHPGWALELGCRMGTLSAHLVDVYGVKVWGTDVDPAQVALARTRYGAVAGLTFQVEDATRLSFPDEHFGVVISHFVFHPIPDWRKACAEVARVARPGGVVLWTDLVVAQPFRTHLLPASRLVGFYTFEAIVEQFRNEGLEFEAHESVRGGTFPAATLVFSRLIDG